MKKTYLYSLAALSVLALASCNQDYSDWADPQSFSAEAAAAKYGINIAAGPEANATANDADGIIELVTVSSTSEGVSGFTVKKVTVNGQEVAATMEGSNIEVSAADLAAIIEKQYDSRASVARDLNVVSTVSINLANGDAVTTDLSGTTAGTFTDYATPALDEKGYYLLGNFAENGSGWDLKNPVWMTDKGNGVYQVMVTTTGTGDNWFKFYCGSNYSDSNWDEVNAGQMGCEVNGDKSLHNFVVYTGDPVYTGGVQTPVINGAGKWLVTLDMVNLTYTVSTPVLYVAGDANSWTQTEPLGSSDGDNFTGFAYLNGNGFKFSTQKDWNGTNYGADFSTAGDAPNITISDPEGYYKVEVSLSGKSLKLTPITTIGLIGDATAGGWSTDTPLTYNKTTHAWEAQGVTLSKGGLKFRANNGWDINWGGKSVDALTQGGDNLSIDEAGTYDVQLFAWADGYAYCVLTKK